MKWLTFKIQTAPGFRFNLLDLLFLALLLLLSGFFHQLLPSSGFFLIPLYLGLSFFLFCNVFRIGNRLEAYWYLPFLLLTGYTLATMNLTLFYSLTGYLFEPLKWGLILYRIKKGGYVGAFYQRLNPPAHSLTS